MMAGGFITELAVKIRKRETPFYDWIYCTAKKVHTMNMPVIPFVHSFLRVERSIRQSAWHGMKQFFYFEPIFRTMCVSCGKNLKIYNGIPMVMGNLRIIIGDNVTMHGAATFTGAKVFDVPTLRIGNNTYLGYGVGIRVGCDVTIGNNVLIAHGVSIMSYDGHPLDAAARIANMPAPPESSRPIIIEDDVWITGACIILKGVRIGKGAVVASGTVVIKDVPPYAVVAGNPARIIKQLAVPEGASGSDSHTGKGA